MKYVTTSRPRDVVNDSMDVMGGAGICRGPNNMIGNGYMQIPIAITVEGANILTRSMITFGQGLNRAHPNLIKIVNTIEKGNDVKGFSQEVIGFLGHLTQNVGRSLARGVGGVFRRKDKKNLSAYYEAELGRLASNFAVCADLALVLGGRLKFEEMLSGRFADAFGTLYLGYACLWYFEQNKGVEGIDALLELAMENILQQNQAALHGLSTNFPVPGIGPLMKAISFPVGSNPYKGPDDAMRKAASTLISTPSGIRTLLSEGVFISKDPNDRVRMLNDYLPLAVQADKVQAAAKKAKRPLTTEEQALVNKVIAAADAIVQVDAFDKLGAEKFQDETYVRPALRGTKFATLHLKNQAEVLVGAKR